MCPGIGRARIWTQIFVEPSLWNPNSWPTKHSVSFPPKLRIFLELGFTHTRKLRKDSFEFSYFLDLEQMSKTFIASPKPLSLKLVGLRLLSSDARGKMEKGKKTKESTSLSPLCSLWGSQVEAMGFHPRIRSGIRPEGRRGEPEGSPPKQLGHNRGFL